jgi:hypothetical protein
VFDGVAIPALNQLIDVFEAKVQEAQGATQIVGRVKAMYRRRAEAVDAAELALED